MSVIAALIPTTYREVSKQSLRCRLTASGDLQIRNENQAYEWMGRSFRARPALRGPWTT